jgi:hypothetical protein
MDAFGETSPGGARGFFAERRLKDPSGFGLHGMAVLWRADAQAFLHRSVDVSDGEGCRGYECFDR